MNSSRSAAYESLAVRMQNAAAVASGVAWAFQALVKPDHGTDAWFWVSVILAFSTSFCGVVAALDARLIRAPLVRMICACFSQGALYSLETEAGVVRRGRQGA